MDKKNFKEAHPEFLERFISIIDTKPTKFWMKELEAQYNLIWQWKKKTFPSLEYVFRVCELSGVSVNWLFFGVGPQFIDDTKNSTFNNYKQKESLNLKLISMFDETEALKIEYETKTSELEQKIKNLEEKLKNSEAIKFIYDIFSEEKQNSDLNAAQQIATLLLPFFSFLELNSNELFELINKKIQTKEGNNVLHKAIKWIKKRTIHDKQ